MGKMVTGLSWGDKGGVFVVEYILRTVATQCEGVSVKPWWKYGESFFGAIDLMSILLVDLPMIMS